MEFSGKSGFSNVGGDSVRKDERSKGFEEFEELTGRWWVGPVHHWTRRVTRRKKTVLLRRGMLLWGVLNGASNTDDDMVNSSVGMVLVSCWVEGHQLRDKW